MKTGNENTLICNLLRFNTSDIDDKKKVKTITATKDLILIINCCSHPLFIPHKWHNDLRHLLKCAKLWARSPVSSKSKNYEISICCFTLYPTVDITLMLPSSLSYINMNRIGGVMVSMLTSSAVGRGYRVKIKTCNRKLWNLFCFALFCFILNERVILQNWYLLFLC
jgi:hypothetical protein